MMKEKTISFNHLGVLSIDTPIAKLFAVLIGSLVIAALAQISIQVPFSPVPITGQTIGVILVGGILGAKRGAFAVMTYLVEGAIGLSVFADFKAGTQVLVGPTAGYLWAFIPAAYLTGYATEKGFTIKPVTCFLTCFTFTTLILVSGTAFLILFNFGFKEALIMGFYPFLVGDVVKSAVCAVLFTGIRKAV
jgi:biotin transport system substrate-specific component